jgi:hypothetical protein
MYDSPKLQTWNAGSTPPWSSLPMFELSLPCALLCLAVLSLLGFAQPCSALLNASRFFFIYHKSFFDIKKEK